MESGAAARGTNTRAKGGQSRNRQRNGTTEVDAAALNRLLAALVAMRDGNFRKRLTVSGDGVDGGDRRRLQRGGGPESASDR